MCTCYMCKEGYSVVTMSFVQIPQLCYVKSDIYVHVPVVKLSVLLLYYIQCIIV